MGYVPVVRRSVREVQVLSSALHSTTTDVLPPLLDLAQRPTWTGRVDPAPFRRLQGPLRQADARLQRVRAQLRSAPHSNLSQLSSPRRELDDELARLAVTLGEARVVADVLPPLVTGDHRYLLAIQNNAEPRATGGLLGAYGLLRVHDGALSMSRVGSDNDLHDPSAPVVQLGEDYDARYARFSTTSTWRSANLTPDAPSAGRILLGLWKKQFGEQLDGVVLTDPAGLADLLGATGPVTLSDGTRITSANAVRALLVDVYRKFPRAADAARNAYLQETARRVVTRLSGSGLSGARVAHALSTAAATGHLQVVASAPAVEAELTTARFGGALRATGPFLSVVAQDVGGSKLGTYLHRAVTYTGKPTGEATDLGEGPQPEEDAVITLVLANAAPAGLPAYVTLRPDDPRAPVGQAKYWLSVYLGHNATMLDATLDGRPVTVETGAEQGLSVLSTFLTIDRGQTRTLRLHVRLTYRQQPLFRPDALVVRRSGPVHLWYEK